MSRSKSLIFGGRTPSADIKDICRNFSLTEDQIKKVMATYLEDLKQSLARKPQHKSLTSLKCSNSYIQDFPTGKEKGTYLVIDFPGPAVRILSVYFTEKHFDQRSILYVLPREIMTGTGVNLFDYLAECLVNYLESNKLDTKETYYLSLLFGFPFVQKGLDKGIIEKWGRGFNCYDAIGKDVVKLLKDAISRRQGLKVDVCAILNYSSATLISCARKSSHCKVGLVAGTTLACGYIERIANVDLFDGDKNKPLVVINTQLSEFGNNGKLDFLRNEFDRDIDEHSQEPGLHIFEKMVGGMYLGELTRSVIEKAIRKNKLLGGEGSEVIYRRDCFYTKFMGDLDSDKPGTYQKINEILNELELNHASEQDCTDIKYICECITIRAATLLSACTAALLNKVNFTNVTVGVDGFLFRFHSSFRECMNKMVLQLVNPGIKCNILLSIDGQATGAALVAALVEQKREGK